MLASCYRRSIEVAAQHGAVRMAFPCISTGVYAYPPDLAATVALAAVREALNREPRMREVVFCCFSAADERRYRLLLET